MDTLLLFFTGEFTPENQVRIKQEEEKEQNKIDPWKVWTYRKLIILSIELPHAVKILCVIHDSMDD